MTVFGLRHSAQANRQRGLARILRAQRPNGLARIGQPLAHIAASQVQVFRRFLWLFQPQQLRQHLQLHADAYVALGQRIVNLARNAIALTQHGAKFAFSPPQPEPQQQHHHTRRRQ